jgi:hypothetical protein
MVITIRREYSDYRIAEVLSRSDRTTFRTHANALAEYPFATYPELDSHGGMPAAGNSTGGKEHVAV